MVRPQAVRQPVQTPRTAPSLIQQRELDPDGRILATLEDYSVVRDLVCDVIADGVEVSVSPSIRKTVDVVASLVDSDGGEVSLTAISTRLKLDKSTASRRVKAAIKRGFLVNQEDRNGWEARIALGNPLPEDLDVLPKPEVLQGDRCTVAT